ncbi:hypothetical protein [Nonomuraea sp. NPDC049784]|uniref:hypothetical protein n=1 Tax=Nonomuraea sp. NPDC049784 TaxID=3154361 RepID=UPI0033CF1531
MDVKWVSGEVLPVEGQAEILTEEQWGHLSAVAIQEVFESGLREMGMPAMDIHHIVSQRDMMYARTSKNLKYWPRDVWPRLIGGVLKDRLHDWFSQRAIQVDKSVDVHVHVPLFVLAAPEVTGCKASFKTQEKTAQKLGWKVSVLGAGLEDSGVLEATISSSFNAVSGETKVVFVPISVPVEKVTIIESGHTIGEGHRVNAKELRVTGNPGLLLLPPRDAPPIGDLAERYPLAGDATGALATYEHVLSSMFGHSLNIGVQAFGSDVGIRTAIETSTSVTLTYELRGGFDYELHFLAEGQGRVWGAITGPSPTGQSKAEG